ncbi:MAG: SAF domain-containing protein [Chloroflexales bacterium]
MRRGGLLILLIGLILIVGAVGLFMFLQTPASSGDSGAPTINPLPTEIPQVEIVQALVDIPANTVITDSAALLTIINIPQSEFDTQQNFSTYGEIEGKLTLRPFRANEPIIKAALVEPGLSQQIPTAEANRANDKAYPFVVNNLTGVADQVKPGDFIDVVATFQVQRPISTIGQAPASAAGAPPSAAPNTLAEQTLRSTKTLVQRAQVIRIVRPPATIVPTPEGAPAAGGDKPAVDATGQLVQPADGAAITQGTWTLVLAINDQEAELMEFAIASEARLVLVLRGAGDTGFEPTIGATFDLLIDEFGLPLPQPLHPYVVGTNEQLTPQPTRTPAPSRVP